MKARLAFIIGILLAIVFSVVVLIGVAPRDVGQDRDDKAAPGRAQVEPPERIDELQEAPAVPGPSAPAPLPTEEEMAAIEDRIEGKVERWPALARLRMWWFLPGQQMPDEEYENARALYLRFLDNFARLETAQFRVEMYAGVNEGPQKLSFVGNIVWSFPRFWTERTQQEQGKESSKWRMVSNGKKVAQWKDGHKEYTGRAGSWGYPDNYVFQMEMASIRDAHPFFLNRYTHCDIDDGTTGYSRLWSEKGAEARFDTATGLLTEEHSGDGSGRTYTYQQVDGLWFLLETIWDMRADLEENQEAYTQREVFSRVSLNEPVDESLFDLNNPG
ncbi:MAG TPA: hypothetical protein VMZ06_15760 [Candidatus Bathyarchaeia archaeon]|nr:hypothetical protein [Candidatus Bathyarchaeia archaeon]